MKHLRSGLRRLHRALGSVLALLVAVWFASGLVMMFVHFPRLTDRARLHGTRPIAHATLTLPSALRAMTVRAGTRVRLASVEDRTIATIVENGRHVFSATAHRALPAFDDERARRLAEARFGRVARVTRRTTPDQWTVPGSLVARLPLFHVALGDASGTELYFAEDTGELVQHTTARERLLAWLGPIPHWIYPTLLREHRTPWKNTVLTLTALALVVAVSGIVTGLRVRWKLMRRGRAEIRDRWLRLHQSLGLLFAIPLCTWLLSGAFSFSIFGRFEGAAPNERLLSAVHGALVLPSDATLRAVVEACSRVQPVHEAELFSVGGETYVECSDARARRIVLDMQGRRARLDPRAIAARVMAAFERADAFELTPRIVDDELVYEDHHDGTGLGEVMRVDVRDARGSAVFVDTARGIVLAEHTHETRVDRVLYQGLHRLDPAWLRARPRLRYVIVGTCMLIGATLASLGFAMALRRAARRARVSTASRSRGTRRVATGSQDPSSASAPSRCASSAGSPRDRTS